jgi:N-methylhydantoinase A/oxoprolinase/acetone carboxylase beta subunit
LSNLESLIMSKQQYRLGIDAGGTFTDFILADRTGNVQLFKAPRRPRTARSPSATAWRKSPMPLAARRPRSLATVTCASTAPPWPSTR